MKPASPEYPIIDVHAHAVSRDQVRDPRNLRLMDLRAESLVPSHAGEYLLERMDLADVGKTCLMGPAHHEGISNTNDMVRELVETHSDRFIGFVGVDPFDNGQDETVEVITRAIQDWKFKGVGEFFGDLLDPRCEVVYQTCIDMKAPLLIHCGAPLPSQLLKHGHPDALDEIANKHPDLTIVAAHVGMPWILETVSIAVRHANVYVDISALPAFGSYIVNGVLALCFSAGLEDRVLFGTDFPLVDPVTYVGLLGRRGADGWLRRILSIPTITKNRRFKLLNGNATRLLNLV